jgi:hypothetical protein
VLNLTDEIVYQLARAINTQEKIKRELATSGTVNTLIALSSGQVVSKNMPTVVSKQDFTGTEYLVLDNATYGLLDNFKLGGGTATLGTYEVEQIYNPNNLWRSYFTSIEDDIWTDSGNTTGTVDTTNQKIVLADGQVWQSNRLTTETSDINFVTFLASNVENSGNLVVQVKSSSGGSFETITLNEETGITAGTDLYLKLSASGGTATIYIKDTTTGVKSAIGLGYR